MDKNTTMQMLDDVMKCVIRAKETLHKDTDTFQVNVVKARGFIEGIFQDLKRDDVNLHAETHVPTDH